MRKIIFFIFIILYAVSAWGIDIENVVYQWETSNTNFDRDKSGYINIGDRIRFDIILSESSPTINDAKVDIGTVYENIQLYNDGTHGDTNSTDNVYTAYWTVPEGTTIHEAPVIGHFWEGAIEKIKTCDTPLSFDAERPRVDNIGVSPNSFNPYIESCEIAYTMSETVDNVVVRIYKDFSTNNLIKKLQKPPLEAGDNFITWWDGKNDLGVWEYNPPDRDYHIRITCRDQSGNYSQGPWSTVKISTIKLEIISLNITPTPVSPNGDGVNDRIHINTKFMMYSWDGANKKNIFLAQMSNLNLTAGSNFSGNSLFADGDLLYFWPYVQTGFAIYDASGTTLKFQPGNDLDNDVDGDMYFLNIFDNIYGSTNYVSDGDKANDWETLAPLYDDGIGGHEIDYGSGGTQQYDGIFTAAHSFAIELLGSWDDGVYIVRAGAELTGIRAEESPVDENHISVHFAPEWKGGYINADMVQATFEVDNSDPYGVDSIAPHVEAVFPEADSKIVYRLSQVSAYIQDNVDGSGISLLKSDIYLSDASGSKILGRKINNGVDVISWELDTPLDIKGKYYINVLPVDKRGNQPADFLKYSFELDVIDDGINTLTVNDGGTVVDDFGKVYLTVPAYAVEQDLRITVFKPFSLPGELTAYGGIQFLPSTVNFKRPVAITLYYTQNDKKDLPSGITETALRIYNWKTDKWEYLGGNVNVNNMSATVSGIRKINGYYALLPETVGGLPGEVLSDVQVDKPFKENGYLSFKVSGSISSMKLLIYTLQGALIRDVPIDLGSINNAGYYSLKWDVVSGNGVIANNGVYIFRFIAQRADGEQKIVSKAIPVIK